ncbi:heterokaryon incompatibility protein-domain-containing protein [Annulohypoxylon maeteangense]|uniref:heterokaryon incompatibility protein-domain-containing protein n=1 Tax=Annulohypoxylon maeteangense TaxID=1927788 RepID=UPI002007DFE3|nr:heterokaryon incompatibility protein-domain-containing protein [Annulohypoxylon maeteangense]KAI0880895.1 heterokaryon incompatibility protein-domain-containing protein [Annulohypoxylon maeteangense]
MEQQPPLVPQIRLPDGWNFKSLGSPNTASRDTRSSSCKTCGWNGDPLELLRPRRLLHAISSRDLSRNCIRCQILALVIKALKVHKTGLLRSPNRVSFCGRNYIRVDDEFSSAYEEVFLFISADSHGPEIPRGIPRGRPEHIDTSSDASFFWAQEQIQAHQYCCQPVNASSFVPTRLIRVNPRGLGKDVVLDDCVPKGTRYAAISYLWGKKTQPCSTTPSTLSDHKKRIKWSTLPKTTQDAIEYTRRLGIEYIWVDCLCMIQNDRADWERESGRMSDIYKNAYVTLTAVWGDDCDSGLFSKSERFRSTPLASLRFNDEDFSLSMRRFHEPISIRGRHSNPGLPNPTPLFDRAWTYQERLISPRVLYFTKKELVFECFCDTACQCCLTQHRLLDYDDAECPKRVFYKVINPTKKLTSSSAQTNAVAVRARESGKTPTKIYGNEIALKPNPYDPREAWANMVSEYSLLNLTNLDDKLPAIAAMARQFQTVRPGERYLAGLWSGSLYRDLLWQTSSQDTQRLTTAPTWSWASISKMPIAYPAISIDQLTPSVRVVEAICRYVDNNPYGVFKTSSLILRGRLISCWVRQKSGHNFELTHLRSGLKIESLVSIDCTDVSFGKVPRKVHLLEIAKGLGEQSTNRHFLILDRESRSRQIFSRVGVLHFSPSKGNHKQNKESMNMVLNGFSSTETVTLI